MTIGRIFDGKGCNARLLRGHPLRVVNLSLETTKIQHFLIAIKDQPTEDRQKERNC